MFEAGWQSGPLATLRLMKLCYPHLKGDGSIINLASSATKRWDMTGYGAYAAVRTQFDSSHEQPLVVGQDNIREPMSFFRMPDRQAWSGG